MIIISPNFAVIIALLEKENRQMYIFIKKQLFSILDPLILQLQVHSIDEIHNHAVL